MNTTWNWYARLLLAGAVLSAAALTPLYIAWVQGEWTMWSAAAAVAVVAQVTAVVPWGIVYLLRRPSDAVRDIKFEKTGIIIVFAWTCCVWLCLIRLAIVGDALRRIYDLELNLVGRFVVGVAVGVVLVSAIASRRVRWLPAAVLAGTIAAALPVLLGFGIWAVGCHDCYLNETLTRLGRFVQVSLFLDAGTSLFALALAGSTAIAAGLDRFVLKAHPRAA